MLAKLLNGRLLANRVLTAVKSEVDRAVASGHRRPGLAVLMIGDHSASALYVKNKELTSREVGIVTTRVNLPASTSTREVVALLQRLNADQAIDGILLQLPVPEGLQRDTPIMKAAISPKKDVDGLTAENAGQLFLRAPKIRACTPAGIIHLLESIEPANERYFRGKHCVIVGQSNLVGRPMAIEFLNREATVTVTHSRTIDLRRHVEQADVLVVAVGKPAIIPGAWIKPGAVVIDVGITQMPDGTLSGDVEFAAAAERAAYISPVPGGVGPMTVAMLMRNTVDAYLQQLKFRDSQ